MKGQVKVHSQPKLENASLVVAWQEDAGKLGPRVIDYLNKHIKGKSFCEIEPVNFFPLGGVAIDDHVAQFPISRFYAGAIKDIVIFVSPQPTHEQYRFLNSILDVAEHYCGVKELYIVSGTVAPIAHTTPRRLWSAFNQSEFQRGLQQHGLEGMTWEGPPAINSYLLWLAQKSGIPGVSLWPEVAFYLAATEDPKTAKSVLSFFNDRFDLSLDFIGLDSEIKEQGEKIAIFRKENSHIDEYIRTLEMGIGLDKEEQVILAQGVTEFLNKTKP